MATLGASFSIITNPKIIQYLLKGTLFTVIISVVAALLSILIGSVLALVRNYCNAPENKIFKLLATIYIEVFRNTPLMLWVFIGVVFLPIPKALTHKMFGLSSVETKLLFKAAISLILFTSAVIAEIIRGGLNAVPKGQFEAAQSQGFSVVQEMTYIILPQAYRKIVPTLLSQVISTIKDTSYLANVAVIELMARTKQLLSSANRYNGTGTINASDVFVLFGTAALIYFIINFTLSVIVRRMQKKQAKVPVRAQTM